MDYLQSELINRGFNEFTEGHQIVFFDENHQFIKKIMKYDKDVQKIVNEKIFLGEKLDTEESDIYFKKMFINRFLDKTIKKQTIELFSTQVIFIFMLYKDYINLVFENLEEFATGKSTSDSKGNINTLSDNRQMTSTLPKNNININVDDTVLNYADDNTINRNRNKSENDNISEGRNYSISTLKQTETLLRNVFKEFNKKCFSQVF